MTDHNVTGGTRRELIKYRIIFAVAIVGLVCTGFIFDLAYRQHVQLLNQGDEVGSKMQRLSVQDSSEGVQHEQR